MRSLLLGGALGGLWGAGYVVAYIVLQDRPDLVRAIGEPELAPVLLFPIGLAAVGAALGAGGTAFIAVSFVYEFFLSTARRRAIGPIAAFALGLVVGPDFVPDGALDSTELSVMLGRALPFRVVPALIAAISVWVSMARQDGLDRKVN